MDDKDFRKAMKWYRRAPVTHVAPETGSLAAPPRKDIAHREKARVWFPRQTPAGLSSQQEGEGGGMPEEKTEEAMQGAVTVYREKKVAAYGRSEKVDAPEAMDAPDVPLADTMSADNPPCDVDYRAVPDGEVLQLGMDEEAASSEEEAVSADPFADMIASVEAGLAGMLAEGPPVADGEYDEEAGGQEAEEDVAEVAMEPETGSEDAPVLSEEAAEEDETAALLAGLSEEERAEIAGFDLSLLREDGPLPAGSPGLQEETALTTGMSEEERAEIAGFDPALLAGASALEAEEAEESLVAAEEAEAAEAPLAEAFSEESEAEDSGEETASGALPEPEPGSEEAVLPAEEPGQAAVSGEAETGSEPVAVSQEADVVVIEEAAAPAGISENGIQAEQAFLEESQAVPEAIEALPEATEENAAVVAKEAEAVQAAPESVMEDIAATEAEPVMPEGEDGTMADGDAAIGEPEVPLVAEGMAEKGYPGGGAVLPAFQEAEADVEAMAAEGEAVQAGQEAAGGGGMAEAEPEPVAEAADWPETESFAGGAAFAADHVFASEDEGVAAGLAGMPEGGQPDPALSAVPGKVEEEAAPAAGFDGAGQAFLSDMPVATGPDEAGAALDAAGEEAVTETVMEPVPSPEGEDAATGNVPDAGEILPAGDAGQETAEATGDELVMSEESEGSDIAHVAGEPGEVEEAQPAQDVPEAEEAGGRMMPEAGFAGFAESTGETEEGLPEAALAESGAVQAGQEEPVMEAPSAGGDETGAEGALPEVSGLDVTEASAGMPVVPEGNGSDVSLAVGEEAGEVEAALLAGASALEAEEAEEAEAPLAEAFSEESEAEAGLSDFGESPDESEAGILEAALAEADTVQAEPKPEAEDSGEETASGALPELEPGSEEAVLPAEGPGQAAVSGEAETGGEPVAVSQEVDAVVIMDAPSAEAKMPEDVSEEADVGQDAAAEAPDGEEAVLIQEMPESDAAAKPAQETGPESLAEGAGEAEAGLPEGVPVEPEAAQAGMESTIEEEDAGDLGQEPEAGLAGQAEEAAAPAPSGAAVLPDPETALADGILLAEGEALPSAPVAATGDMVAGPKVVMPEEEVFRDKMRSHQRNRMAVAEYKVAAAYAREGTEKAYQEAVKWYTRAAEKGHAVSCFNLGNIYYAGRGVVQDYAKAADWYELAARQGVARAQDNLGLMFFHGRGRPVEPETAVYWFRQAAIQGFAPAQYKLAIHLEAGVGVEPNREEALYWFRKAASQGHEQAEKEAARLE
ncbi:MAG: hypothetical protein NC211_06770 [Alistipes senegalensis]|nr:hypothetical protein [Oxalobacter formigenes]MCM1281513.1 hypothetical protein [Alistipes senegalensis]